MQLGCMISAAGIDDAIKQAHATVENGYDTAWFAQIFGMDALTAIAVLGREVPELNFGTAVIPTYPRHPQTLAMQAMTTQHAIGGRLTLGIGLSHQLVIENMYGLSFDKPARHMREYLSILLPLLRGETVQVSGETLTWNGWGPMDIPATPAPEVLLAALAPRMLELAGATADGTVTWMTGPTTVADHIVPSINAAAEKAGRSTPRVVVGLPVALTDDPDGAREQAAAQFAVYGQLPSYRAMLDREGAAGPADVAIVGSEDEIAKGIQRVVEAGATDFLAACFGDVPNTLKVVSNIIRG